ncbi:hypothetical protein POTOM_021699 [Populus tomentosa]|uniref:Thioredoxin domain-containing protein n=1 Tax=Populus tomentosa TaxID=118781 RepID=A0A8X7ZRP3_POPTO|nr:hypothetical protein POTOM_021699 [Populus tomentosa]
MAISSLSASTIPSLNTRNSTSNYSSKLSSFSSLQFPAQLHRLQFRNRGVSSHSRQRNLPLCSSYARLLELGCLRETCKIYDAVHYGGEHYSDAHDYSKALGVIDNHGIQFLILLWLYVAAKKQTFSTFDELLQNSDKPVLVDFYATWCGPCQFMAPVLDEVGAVLKDTVQVVKIDTEKYPSIADKYKIEALPTFIIFKDAKPYDRFEGALTKDQLIQRIESSLNVKQ